MLARFEKLQPGEAVMSVISLGEMVYGASKSARKVDLLTQLDHLRRFLQVAPLPEAAAEACGAIRTELEHRGRLIGNNDLWIAAHAVASRLTLVINNVKEFARIDGLAIENWVS